MKEVQKLKDFFIGYRIASLWSTSDDKNESEFLDELYSIDDFNHETKKAMELDCIKFMGSNKDDLETYADEITYNIHESLSAYEVSGHDFWLNRNGHGCGFWDRRGLNQETGERLSEASKAFNECHLYVGDDNQIHMM